MKLAFATGFYTTRTTTCLILNTTTQIYFSPSLKNDFMTVIRCTMALYAFKDLSLMARKADI